MHGDLICKKVVRRKLGNVSHMFLRRRLKDDPSFPRPVRLTPHEKAKLFWSEQAINEWIEKRAALTAQEMGRA